MRPTHDLRGYLLVAGSYQAFTLSDGALRMLVLLHLHEHGQTAWALALLLVPYEVAGVLTNLTGGFVGARYGLKAPLAVGLALQAVACAMLAVDAASLTLGYVALTQVLSGVAKDLAKTSAKSYVRALAPAHADAGLFRLVAWMTGSKNTFKGLGFFVGGALLTWVGFARTNVVLAAGLGVAALLAVATLPRVAGREGARVGDVLRQDGPTWWLSAARLFLFGSRDAWFAVALPLYLVTVEWSEAAVGAFLAGWVVLYGVVQVLSPRLTRRQGTADGARGALGATLLLLGPLAATALALAYDLAPRTALVVGLAAYGFVFALTSGLHSWLVVALGDGARTPERVGFYYAANACGRLAGTLVGGYVFHVVDAPAAGLAWCLAASAAMVIAAALATAPLTRSTGYPADPATSR